MLARGQNKQKIFSNNVVHFNTAETAHEAETARDKRLRERQQRRRKPVVISASSASVHAALASANVEAPTNTLSTHRHGEPRSLGINASLNEETGPNAETTASAHTQSKRDQVWEEKRRRRARGKHQGNGATANVATRTAAAYAGDYLGQDQQSNLAAQHIEALR